MGKNKKIAFVSYCGDPWGGSEVLWYTTAKLALSLGYDVLVSVFNFGEKNHPNILELKRNGAKIIFRRRFYPTINIRIKKYVYNKLNIFKEKYTYFQYLNDFKPDEILFSLSGGNEFIEDDEDAMLFLRQTKFSFSIFYHNLDEVPKCKINYLSNTNYLLNKAKYSFFTSKFQVEIYKKGSQVNLKNIKILSHPIKTNVTANEIQFPDTSVINFAIIGRIHCRMKGHDILVEIFKSEKWKNRQYVLNIYGEGEDKAYLEYLIEQYALSENVHFLGFETDFNKIWDKNHILLIPSRQDSGPIVLFEAMAYARPVIGSYMGAMPEYIINEYNGILADGIMKHNFETALENAWENKAKWKEWGENGKKLLEKKFCFNAEQQLLELIVK